MHHAGLCFGLKESGRAEGLMKTVDFGLNDPTFFKRPSYSDAIVFTLGFRASRSISAYGTDLG